MAVKGWKGIIKIANTSSGLANASNVGATEMPITLGNSVESTYIIGSRTPTDLVEGNIELTGTVKKQFNNSAICYVDGVNDKTLHEAAGLGTSGNLSTWAIKISPNGADSNPSIYLWDCKFGGWSLEMSQDGIIAESAEFTAKTVNISTQ